MVLRGAAGEVQRQLVPAHRGRQLELDVPVAPLEDIGRVPDPVRKPCEAGTAIEIVTVRLTAIVPGPELELSGAGGPSGRVTGPAVLHLPETTVAVPARWAGAVDDSGTLVLERAQ